MKKATALSGDDADWEELTFTEGDVTLDANGQPTVTITPEEDENTAFYKFVVPNKSDDAE